MSKRRTDYQCISVVENVYLARHFKIVIPSKVNKLLFSIGFGLVISLAFLLFSILSSETATAGTVNFNDTKSVSYRIINNDGSITRLTDSFKEEYGQLQIGDTISIFPIATKEEKLLWIENLINNEKETFESRKNWSKDKLTSILGSKERAEYVLTYSKEFDIPLYLVVGVIFAESSNTPSAVSRVGARGLMQLMPDTAVIIARKAGLSRIALNIRQDPKFLNTDEEINIKFGCAHLRDLYNKIGSWEGSLHAYNQGYARYISGHRSSNYVKKVLNYWEKFEKQ